MAIPMPKSVLQRCCIDALLTRPPAHYPLPMNVVRTFELDPETDARLQAIAAARGQGIAAVVADAVALLDAVVPLKGPDTAEDVRRLREFERTGEAIPLDEVKAWVESWGSANELPRPNPRKIT
jgi:predicted transcriptional regulator